MANDFVFDSEIFQKMSLLDVYQDHQNIQLMYHYIKLKMTKMHLCHLNVVIVLRLMLQKEE